MINFIFREKTALFHLAVFCMVDFLAGFLISKFNLGFFAGFLTIYAIVRLNFVSLLKVQQSRPNEYMRLKFAGGIPILLMCFGISVSQSLVEKQILSYVVLAILCSVYELLISMIALAYKK